MSVAHRQRKPRPQGGREAKGHGNKHAGRHAGGNKGRHGRGGGHHTRGGHHGRSSQRRSSSADAERVPFLSLASNEALDRRRTVLV